MSVCTESYDFSEGMTNAPKMSSTNCDIVKYLPRVLVLRVQFTNLRQGGTCFCRQAFVCLFVKCTQKAVHGFRRNFQENADNDTRTRRLYFSGDPDHTVWIQGFFKEFYHCICKQKIEVFGSGGDLRSLSVFQLIYLLIWCFRSRLDLCICYTVTGS